MRFQLKTVAVREDGCFSVLLHEGQPFAVTCERTFDSEKPVIPAGTFWCEATVFHRGGYPTYEIRVPGHSRVLFHRGNLETDSEGCVLVAESFAILQGVTAVGDSKAGFAEFMLRTNGELGFWLDVTGR